MGDPGQLGQPHPIREPADPCAPASRASRVLPVPPVPVNVTSRACPSKFFDARQILLAAQETGHWRWQVMLAGGDAAGTSCRSTASSIRRNSSPGSRPSSAASRSRARR